MLERQVENWNQFPAEVQDIASIIVVDDGSPKHPALPLMQRCRIPKALFRVDVDIRWHQHPARNIGAHEAGEDDVWLFCSDIDIVLPPDAALSMVRKELNPRYYYSFARVFAPQMLSRKIHHNTFLVRRGVYWEVGGYDEDYVGTYCSESPFLRQLAAIAPHEHFADIVTIGHPAVNTAAGPRDESGYMELFERKCRNGDERARNPLRNSWTRLL
jgi:hypothetical protein